MHKQRIVILSAAGLGLLSCLLPWVILEIDLFGRVAGTGSINALNDWAGFLAFLGFIGAGSFGILGEDKKQAVPKKYNKFIALCGAVAFLMTLIFIIRVGMGGPSISSLGIGSYLSIIASIVVAAIPFVIKGEGKFEMPSGDSLKKDFEEMTEGTPLSKSGSNSGSTSQKESNKPQDSNQDEAKKEDEQETSEDVNTDEKKEE